MKIFFYKTFMIKHKKEVMDDDKNIKSYSQLFLEILINIKNTWFGLLDDLLQQKFYIETFTKNNRLLYLGLTIIIIALIVFLLNAMNENFDNNKKKIYQVHYIYYMDE